MEDLKVGDKFELKGKIYKIVEWIDDKSIKPYDEWACKGCDLFDKHKCICHEFSDLLPKCICRADNKEVVFKEIRNVD